MKNFTVIAIDGGAGTGKSTTANLLSRQFNFLHVDTGSHYRAITAALLDSQGLEPPHHFRPVSVQQ